MESILNKLFLICCLVTPFGVSAGVPTPPAWLEQLANQVSKQVGMDANMIKAVVWVESAYNHQAVSHKGAMGLMQLMPATAKDLGVRDAFHPEQNVSGGARYLKQMILRFGSVKQGLWAYNFGPGALTRALNGKTQIPQETQQYSQKVIKTYYNLKALEQRK